MQGASFTREERLRRSREFLRTKKEGKRHLAESFVIYTAPNTLCVRRLGISAGSRVGAAARRNRIKRLLKEFFRLNKNLFPESSDILISVRKTTAVKNYGDIEKELKGLFKTPGRGQV